MGRVRCGVACGDGAVCAGCVRAHLHCQNDKVVVMCGGRTAISRSVKEEKKPRLLVDVEDQLPPKAASKTLGGAFLISRSVDARSQPWRAWAPQHKKQKQSAEGAILWSKLSKTCGFPCILVTQATVQPSHHSIDRPDRPGPSTTRPADRPTTSHPLDPPLALGLTAL